MLKKPLKRKLKLPRAPLPRQTGGAHVVKKDKKKPKHHKAWHLEESGETGAFRWEYN